MTPVKTSASLLCQNLDYVMELKRFCFFPENQSSVDDSEWLSENVQFFFCLHGMLRHRKFCTRVAYAKVKS